MESALEKLVSEALKLSANERAAFAQLLLASLHESTDHDDAWEVEVERRIAEVESGRAQPIPMADALVQVRSNLK